MRRSSKRFRPLKNMMIATWIISLLSFIAFSISDENVAWAAIGVFFGFVATVFTIAYLPLWLLTRDVGVGDESRPSRARSQVGEDFSTGGEPNETYIGRHGGGAAHIIRAARYYVVAFSNDAVFISEKLGDRVHAKHWARDFAQSPESTPVAHVIALDSIEKVILGPLVEIVTGDRRFMLDGWFNRRDDSHQRQLLDVVRQPVSYTHLTLPTNREV